MCEWCGHTGVILTVKFMFYVSCMSVLLIGSISYLHDYSKKAHGFSVPCNLWAGTIMAKGKSDDLTAIFAKGDHMASTILSKGKKRKGQVS